jgi:cytochrome c oxidase subunit II
MAALTVGLAVFLTACGQNYPDSIFHGRTDFNRDVDFLFKILIYAGTAVFIFVEFLLVLTLIKYRKRPGQPEPKHVHGNTTMEIAWTVTPLLILVLIAIPTVRVIFKTQAKARADALQVEVIGHQWWWEFRYPQYTTTGTNGRVDTVVTANELYLPIGKTVNFTLKSRDVIHSFWIPALGGKRDVVSNHTNYLWFTPDSVNQNVWNGACAEYCGTSHANMRFKAFTVSQADFESWAAHQLQPAEGSPAPAAPVTPTGVGAGHAGDAGGLRVVPTREPSRLRSAGNAAADESLVRRQPARVGERRQRRQARAGRHVHRLPHRPRRADDDGPHRPESDASRHPHDDRRGSVPERSAAPRAVGERREQDEAGGIDEHLRHRRIRSDRQSDREAWDWLHRSADRRHRRVPDVVEITNR